MLIKTLFTLSIFGISACSSLNDQERSPEDQKKASNFDSKSSEVSDIFSEMDNMKNEFVSNRTGLYLLYNLSPGNYENCEQVEHTPMKRAILSWSKIVIPLQVCQFGAKLRR